MGLNKRSAIFRKFLLLFMEQPQAPMRSWSARAPRPASSARKDCAMCSKCAGEIARAPGAFAGISSLWLTAETALKCLSARWQMALCAPPLILTRYAAPRRPCKPMAVKAWQSYLPIPMPIRQMKRQQSLCSAIFGTISMSPLHPKYYLKYANLNAFQRRR